MATNTEEILLRVGMDQAGVDSGTRKLIDTQKKAASEYVSFWKRAIDQKEEMETRAAVEGATRRNRARDLLRQREVEQARRHARDMASIEQGFVPESWQRAGAMNDRYRKYGYGPQRMGMGGGMIEMSVASEAAGGLLSGRESGKLGKDIASAAVEGGIFAIVYELVKSAFKSTAKNLGKNVFGKIPAGLGPVGAAAAAAGYGMYSSGKDAVSAGNDMVASNVGGRAMSGIGYGDMINDAVDSGIISFEEARNLLRNGTQSDFLSLNSRIKSAQSRASYLGWSGQMADAANASRMPLFMKRKAMQSAVDAHNFETVTISDIAGRDFSAGLASQFGEGGQYDLGAGKGRLAKVAQEYEKARYSQMWWRMQGNKVNADYAKERMNSMEKILVDYGAQSPKMDLAAMRRGIDTMTAQLNNLSVRIIGTE